MTHKPGPSARLAQGASAPNPWAPACPASCCYRQDPSLPVGPDPTTCTVLPKGRNWTARNPGQIWGFCTSLSLPELEEDPLGGHGVCVGFLLSLTPLGSRPRDTLLPLSWWWGSGTPCARLRKPGSLRGHSPDPGGHLWGGSEQCGGEECRGSLAGVWVSRELSLTPFSGSQSLMVAACYGLIGHLVQWHHCRAGETEAWGTGSYSRSHSESVAVQGLEPGPGSVLAPPPHACC